MTNVCVGNVNGLSVSATRIVAVPLMTNIVQVEAGEELLMEKPELPKKAKAPTADVPRWKKELARQGPKV